MSVCEHARAARRIPPGQIKLDLLPKPAPDPVSLIWAWEEAWASALLWCRRLRGPCCRGTMTWVCLSLCNVILEMHLCLAPVKRLRVRRWAVVIQNAWEMQMFPRLACEWRHPGFRTVDKRMCAASDGVVGLCAGCRWTVGWRRRELDQFDRLYFELVTRVWARQPRWQSSWLFCDIATDRKLGTNPDAGADAGKGMP